MAYFIGYESALDFWRANPRDAESRAPRVRFDASKAPTAKEARRLRQAHPSLGGETLHLLVDHPSKRRRPSGMRCHVECADLPPRSFVRVDRDLYVASPEFCFVQMARTMRFEALVALGFEWTGRYALTNRVQRGFTETRPRMSRASLLALLSHASMTKGVKAARAAADKVLDNSGSPLESYLAMMTFFPSSRGGFHMLRPKLNFRIFRDKTKRSPNDTGYFEGDLTWPDHHFILEYDGNYDHTSQSDLEHDASRRAALVLEGFNVVVVRRSQLYSFRELQTIETAVAKATGRAIRNKDAATMTKRLNLQHRLLSHGFRNELLVKP